jgi:type IV secretory pathway TraG/TraD family ATPase VirD4
LFALARLTDEKCLETVFKMYNVLVKGGSLSGRHPDAGPLLDRLEELLSGKPDEVRQILASIGNILKPFRDKPWNQIFSQEGDYFLQTARDEGRIMLVRISPNTSGYQSGLFLLKALWFDTIMERLEPNFKGNKTRLCLYLCDEFHKIARPGSESKFFDVRREANAVPVVAFQQISQLEDVLGKSEAISVFGMLSVKMALRNSDPETNEYFSWLSGEIDQIAESKTTPSDTSILSWKGSSTTESRERLPRIHPNFFLELPDGDGVVFETGKKPFCAWFGDAMLNPEREKAWRKRFWPKRTKLSKPPRFLR